MVELPIAFLDRLRALEGAYLRETDPVRQSGFGGGPERWRTERALILDAVPDDGDFLDVGCANGYLLECPVQWGHERHARLTPYGVKRCRLCFPQTLRSRKLRRNSCCHNLNDYQPGRRQPTQLHRASPMTSSRSRRLDRDLWVFGEGKQVRLEAIGSSRPFPAVRDPSAQDG